MNYKAPSREALQAECDAFNASCPVGGRVAVKIDGTDQPRITTTRSEAQILSGHSAVVWMHGVSGCYLLSHVTPIPDVHDGEEAWAVFADNGNCIIWSYRREQVAGAAEKYGKQVVPLRVPSAPAWSAEPPTEQGDYWHWNGDRDSAPHVLSILWSGTARKCFVTMNQSYTGHAIMCDEYGGYWLRLRAPSIPEILPTKGTAK